MKILSRLKWRFVVVAAVLIALGSAGLVFWRAQRALRIATAEVHSQQTLRFSVRNLAPVNSNFEWINAPEAFSGAAVFKGEFYLCGASGLFRYDSHGTLLKHYRPGQDLPSTPLLRMSIGLLKDAKEPELLIATLSEGVLAFNGASFRQLFPADADARSITSLLPLSSGQLLIGTRKRGVLAYDGHSLQSFHPALAGLHVTELAGSESDLWVGTQDQGIVHLQAGRAEIFAEAQGMPDAQIFSIALVNDKVYAGTAVGIAEFDGGRFGRVLAPGTFARTLYVNGATLFSGGSGEGILEIDPQPKRMQGLLHPATRSMSDVQQIFAENNTLYVVTRNALYQKEGQRGGWRRVLASADGTLADRNISA
ncbi:MAG TPA: hypothetical protein VH724_20395, partial [Candidatus Angelobacter sp.]|nr:hypothetical protein [Candidatus Angelobacter sp.]